MALLQRTDGLGSRLAPAPSVRPAAFLPPLARLGQYAGFLAASIVLLVVGLRLDWASLNTPFEDGSDTYLILPLVKATLERGSHWRNERLGAPGIQELHDFPVVDHLHFAIIWAMSRIWPDPFVVYNLYYLLTYPLTVLTTMLVLRHFGLSVPAAGAGGLLYAFLPYHYLRGEHHYFLAAYYVVPLSLMVSLWVCRGRLPFFTADTAGGYRFKPWSADALVAVVIGALTASAGAYYAFFACALLVPAGCYGWVAARTWRAAASAGLVVGVVVAAGLANHAPAIAYQLRHGHNAAAHARAPEEAEHHGMKLTHLLLPVSGHQSRLLAAAQAAYDSPARPLQDENKGATLGLVASAGFVGLLAVAVLPARRGWPLGPLAGLNLFAVLLGTIGGLGSLFSTLVSPQVRAYNRVSVDIAFLSLFAVAWVLDRLLAGRPGWVRWGVTLAVAAVGVWDQCARPWFRADAAAGREEAAARYRADAAFFGAVERAMPGGMVYNLPYIRYPEDYHSPLGGGYEHARGYLHTRTVRWSYGAMKGRAADQWQREVAAAPPAELVRRLAIRGFDGLLLDLRGYSPAAGAALAAAVTAEAGAGAPRIAHPDGRQVVFDLRPARDRLRRELGGRFDELRRLDEEAVRVLWLGGFADWGPLGREGEHRWCGPTGQAVFVNPTDRPRTLRLSMIVRTDREAYSDLKITGGSVWADRFPVNRHNLPREWTVVVPPGRHVVRFRCRPPAGAPPGEPQRTFFVAQFRVSEVR